MRSESRTLETSGHPLDALLGESLLVAGLAGRQHREVVDALVADQGLADAGVAVDDVDEIEDDAALATHDQIEIAQAHVEIDDHRLVALLGEADGERGARRGLADPAFAGGHDDDFGQLVLHFPRRVPSRPGAGRTAGGPWLTPCRSP